MLPRSIIVLEEKKLRPLLGERDCCNDLAEEPPVDNGFGSTIERKENTPCLLHFA